MIVGKSEELRMLREVDLILAKRAKNKEKKGGKMQPRMNDTTPQKIGTNNQFAKTWRTIILIVRLGGKFQN